jgi:hypothetical protein
MRCLRVASVTAITMSLGTPLWGQIAVRESIDSRWNAPITTALTEFPIDTLRDLGRRLRKRKNPCFSVVVVNPAVYRAGAEAQHYAEPLMTCMGTLRAVVLPAAEAKPWQFVATDGFALVNYCGGVLRRHSNRSDTVAITLAIPNANVGDASETVIAFWVTLPWGWPGWVVSVWLQRDGQTWRSHGFRFAEE